MKLWGKLRSETKVREIQSNKLSYCLEEINCHVVLKKSEPIINVDNFYTIYKQNVVFQFNYFMQVDGSTSNFMHAGHHIYIICIWTCVHVGVSLFPAASLRVLRPTLLLSKRKKIPQLAFCSLPAQISFLPQSFPKHAEATYRCTFGNTESIAIF